MSYKQVRDFNPSKAGTTKNLCLQNVRLGYSVPGKYDSAWEAWQHTEQHKNRKFPKGREVPAYFIYWATLGKVYANWGHIGVVLADGRFWSDGKIYASVAAYEAVAAPTFVGWGESVNDVKVVSKEIDMLTTHMYNVLRVFRLGQAPTKDQAKKWVGKVTPDAMDKMLVSSPKYAAEIKRIKNGGDPTNHLPKEIRAVVQNDKEAVEAYRKKLIEDLEKALEVVKG